ncbi:MAG: hypothetical protein HIU89_18290 [Proteobacteria bacterium]|nr:hypothetical protein [Pseudomonadota bacterium]
MRRVVTAYVQAAQPIGALLAVGALQRRYDARMVFRGVRLHLALLLAGHLAQLAARMWCHALPACCPPSPIGPFSVIRERLLPRQARSFPGSRWPENPART